MDKILEMLTNAQDEVEAEFTEEITDSTGPLATLLAQSKGSKGINFYTASLLFFKIVVFRKIVNTSVFQNR